jgi:tRNA-dihydrouridine synthase
MSILKIAGQYGFKASARSSLEHERKFKLKALRELILNNSELLETLEEMEIISEGWIVPNDLTSSHLAQIIESMVSLTNADSSLKSIVATFRHHFVLIVSKYDDADKLFKHIQQVASTNSKLEEAIIEINLDNDALSDEELYE